MISKEKLLGNTHSEREQRGMQHLCLVHLLNKAATSTAGFVLYVPHPMSQFAPCSGDAHQCLV